MLNKRYIQCGAEYRISPSSDPYQNYVKTGLNTGNLYIGHAVNSLFKTQRSFNLWEDLSDEEVDNIRSNNDIVVMGASNFINQSTDFQIPADNLDKLKLPVIVLGIGAQAANDTVKKIKLTKGTEKFLHKISEYSVSIGVRGDYTAELMNNLGIKNITIIGCPTYYINEDINFRVVTDGNIPSGGLVPALNYTDISQKCDEKILKLAFNNNFRVIGQTEYLEEYWKWNLDYREIGEDIKRKGDMKEKLYRKILKQDISEIKEFMRSYFYQFYDIDQWTSHIKQYNFSFGTRFHGNMIAVQNKIPALLVTHDSRTKELAEFCNIPYIDAHNLVGDIRLESLYELVDYSKFNLEYSEKYRNYIDFLKLNGVTEEDILMPEEKDLEFSKEYVQATGIIIETKKKSVSIMNNHVIDMFNERRVIYKCPLENIAKLGTGPCISSYYLMEDGLHVQVSGNDPMVILPNFVNREFDQLVVKILLASTVSTTLEIFYEIDKSDNQYPYTEARKVSQTIFEGHNEVCLAIEAEGIVKSLRLDIGCDVGEYILKELEIRA